MLCYNTEKYTLIVVIHYIVKKLSLGYLFSVLVLSLSLKTVSSEVFCNEKSMKRELNKGMNKSNYLDIICKNNEQ